MDLQITGSESIAGAGIRNLATRQSTEPMNANRSSGAGGDAAAVQSYDPRDINKDGVVSAEEEYLYSLTHSESVDAVTGSELSNNQAMMAQVSELKATAEKDAGYTAQGTMQTNGYGVGGIISITA